MAEQRERARAAARAAKVGDESSYRSLLETEGPSVGPIGEAGFGSKLLKSALKPFDGKTEIAYLKTGVHCTMQCQIPSG